MEKKANCGEVQRKRGRPAGKNRAPLSQEERRARNAQYERERRVEMSDALAELAVAAGCSPSMSNADLLATVITQLEQASRVKHSSDLASLRRCNKNLLAQIESLEHQLGEPHECQSDVPAKEEAGAVISRPVKRRRGDFHDETEAEGAGYIPMPEYAPPEYIHTPPAYSPEQEHIPEPTDFKESHLEPEVDQSAEPDFLAYYERSLITEPAQEYEDMALQYPDCSAVPTKQFMPVPKISPPSNSSDHLPGEQATIDISCYNFAGAHITTPEYILPEQPQLPLELDQTAPQDSHSTSGYINCEPHYVATVDQQQPTDQVVDQPDV